MWKAEDYAACRTPGPNGEMMWMDDLHVKLLYDIFMACDFQRVAEIGCWDGYSASAIVRAKQDGKSHRIKFVDVAIRPQLQKVCEGVDCGFDIFTGVEYLKRNPKLDCIIIDGDHSLANVQAEFAEVMRLGIPTIIAHDVGHVHGDAGPVWMLEQLQKLDGWWVAVDEQCRRGMATDRGFMLATRDHKVYEACAPLFSALIGKELTRDNIIARASINSALDIYRLNSLWTETTAAARREGVIIECGCGEGGSSVVIAGALKLAGSDKRFEMYDTFEGLPAPDADVDTSPGKSREWAMACTGSARGTVEGDTKLHHDILGNGPPKMVKGLYAETLPLRKHEPISLLHADADWYYSTDEIIRYLWPDVVEGGVVIFDDYYFWNGCRKRVDELLADPAENIEVVRSVSCSLVLRKMAHRTEPDQEIVKQIEEDNETQRQMLAASAKNTQAPDKLPTHFPTLSVILPTLNDSFRLGVQLQAILPQLKECDELLLQLDGSDALTRSVAEAFSHPCLKIESIPYPSGVCRAYNRLGKLASKEWILGASGNDEVQPGAIDAWRESVIQFPEARVVHGWIERDNRRPWKWETDYVYPEEMPAIWRKVGWATHGACTFIRSDVWGKGYVEELQWLADNFQTLILAWRYGCVELQKHVSRILFAPGEFSSQHANPKLFNAAQIAVRKEWARPEYDDVRDMGNLFAEITGWLDDKHEMARVPV